MYVYHVNHFASTADSNILHYCHQHPHHVPITHHINDPMSLPRHTLITWYTVDVCHAPACNGRWLKQPAAVSLYHTTATPYDVPYLYDLDKLVFTEVVHWLVLEVLERIAVVSFVNLLHSNSHHAKRHVIGNQSLLDQHSNSHHAKIRI